MCKLISHKLLILHYCRKPYSNPKRDPPQGEYRGSESMAPSASRNSLILATPEDDSFHAVTSPESNWIETLWFPFWIPETRLTCYVHIHFCPNAGVYRGSVSAWRGDNDVVFMHRFEEALPSLREYGDLTRINLPVGLSVKCRKSQQTFDVRYEHEDCSFTFVFDSFMLPVMIAPDASPGMFQGHMNQAGRVSGTFQLYGQTSQINCFSVRDRSWGPRKVATGHRAGNCHGTGANASFYIYVKPDEQGKEWISNGHLLIGDTLARVVSGERQIHWVDDQATKIELVTEDELGRRMVARGECLNQRLTRSPPNLCVVLNLVKWEIDGVTLWGESHDVWADDAWVESGRSLPQ
jgi:hypothetical protein